MLLLDQDKKDECLEDVTGNFYGLLKKLKIILSLPESYRILLKIVQDLVVIRYFTNDPLSSNRPNDIGVEALGSRFVKFSLNHATSPKSPVRAIRELNPEFADEQAWLDMTIALDSRAIDLQPGSPNKKMLTGTSPLSLLKLPVDDLKMLAPLSPISMFKAALKKPEFCITIPEACTDMSIISLSKEELSLLASEVVEILSKYRVSPKEEFTSTSSEGSLSPSKRPCMDRRF